MTIIFSKCINRLPDPVNAAQTIKGVFRRCVPKKTYPRKAFVFFVEIMFNRNLCLACNKSACSLPLQYKIIMTNIERTYFPSLIQRKKNNKKSCDAKKKYVIPKYDMRYFLIDKSYFRFIQATTNRSWLLSFKRIREHSGVLQFRLSDDATRRHKTNQKKRERIKAHGVGN